MIPHLNGFFLASLDSLDRQINLFLPLIGIVIIFLCLLSFFFPMAKPLRDRTQKFTGLGVSMEISVLTVFVLMGFILSLSSFFLQWKGYLDQKETHDKLIATKEGEITELKRTVEVLRDQIEQSTRSSMVLGLELQHDPAKGKISPKPGDLTCEYQVGDSQPKQANVSAGSGAGDVYKVTIEDITRDAYIRYIKLSHREMTHRQWAVENLIPSERRYRLLEVTTK